MLSENRIDLLLFRVEYFSNEVDADQRTEEWHADSSLRGLPHVCVIRNARTRANHQHTVARMKHIRVSEVAALLAISTNDGLGIQDLRILQASTGTDCATDSQQLGLSSHFVTEFVQIFQDRLEVFQQNCHRL